ncbi:hypothetical protein CSA56_09135 [candidate division KSB3 bacterium]|uniref:Uncharacterized protein n=1 Tax=candidate division KSB3 bacterium TaxID=2044937 RepID=A0A2G6KGY1_9BACT|nr:MAG: hypothetical protein CSA56_09135 [candidate division KSB3 bacterium]
MTLIVLLLLIPFQAESQTSQVEPHQMPGLILEPLPSSGKTLCAINLRDAEPLWFLFDSAGNTQLGTHSTAFGYINSMKASPDGQYLAVISVGEGHSMLEVVELQQFIQQRTYQVVQQIDPYPGTISLEGWKGSQLHVRSDMLLTHRDLSTGRVPDTMTLGSEETFAVSIITGDVSGVSDGAKNPAEHYVKVLLDQSIGKMEKDKALVNLLSSHLGELTLTKLIELLEQEQDPKRINRLLDEINKLQGK